MAKKQTDAPQSTEATDTAAAEAAAEQAAAEAAAAAEAGIQRRVSAGLKRKDAEEAYYRQKAHDEALKAAAAK